MEKEIFVTRSSLPTMEDYVNEISDIWESHWLTNMGKKHKTLQNLLKDYLEVENVDLLTNGHMTLELSIQALNLQGEIITTPFTFASTTHAIVRNGCTPVFCDINPGDFTIDADKIEALITDRTSAILPVHVYGNVCDVDAIEAVAAKYGLKVLYDAAHAFGVKYKGRGIGSFGDVSCFSFHATKLFHTIEGGAVCFGDEHKDFGQAIDRLKNFGIKNAEVVDAVGTNAKMNEFCAAMGICNLKRMDVCLKSRKRLADEYRSRLGNVEGLHLNEPQRDLEQNYAYFPIFIDEKRFGTTRDEVLAKLAERNIFARKYFYPLTNTFDAFCGRFDPEKTPIALRISQGVLTLPLYEELDMADADRIADIVLGCKR